MDYNYKKFQKHILKKSTASDFTLAKSEWKLVGIEILDEFDTCPCGQSIKEICYIENKTNGEKTRIGNLCAGSFIGISTGKLFYELKKISEGKS